MSFRYLEVSDYYISNIKELNLISNVSVYLEECILNYIKLIKDKFVNSETNEILPGITIDDYLNVNCKDCKNCAMCVSCYKCDSCLLSSFCFECKKCIKCENSNKCIHCYEDLDSKFQSEYLFNCKNCKGCSYGCNNVNCGTSEYFNNCKNCNGLTNCNNCEMCDKCSDLMNENHKQNINYTGK